MDIQQDCPHELVGTRPGTNCEGPGHTQFWIQGVPSLPHLLPPPSSFFPALTCLCAKQILITTVSMSCFPVEPNYWAALSSSFHKYH